MQALDFGAHLDPQLGVEVGERLVEQEHLRLGTNAWPIATRWRGRRKAPLGRWSSRSLELQHSGDFGDAPPRAPGWAPRHLHPEGHVLRDGRDGRERVGLEHHGDVAALDGCSSLRTAPSIEIFPSLIVARPAMALSRVDLPQPDGPRSTIKSPFSTARSMPLTTSTAP